MLSLFSIASWEQEVKVTTDVCEVVAISLSFGVKGGVSSA